VIIGNRLCQEIVVAKHNGHRHLDPRAIRSCVREASRSFGNEQLAICANHIASSGMPSDAARMEYDEIYTGDSEYSRGLAENLVEVIQLIGKDRFSRQDLEVAALHAAELFGEGSDALSVLWQNRLLGYIEDSPDGALESFFSETSSDQFNLPLDKREYCFHSSLIDRVGIEAVGAPVGRTQAAKTSVAVLAGSGVPEPARDSSHGANDPVPTHIGSYPVLEVVGRGGMGVVYLAKDTELKRRIAIKVLPGKVAKDPSLLARFRMEAQILAALNHPNIATIFTMEEASGRKFLTMEFVVGDTLHDLVRKGPLVVGDALRIAHQIARALEAAHRSGVVHRDLKPANVMLTDDKRVKVLDFGLAKALAGDFADECLSGAQTTSSGVMLGSPGYVSPEQIRGEQVDVRTDIWGFGCTLFECLAGRPAFDGVSAMQRVSATLEAEPDWAVLPRKVPKRTRRLLQQCLQKDPGKRIARIEPVIESLAQSSA